MTPIEPKAKRYKKKELAQFSRDVFLVHDEVYPITGKPTGRGRALPLKEGETFLWFYDNETPYKLGWNFIKPVRVVMKFYER